MNPNIFSDLRKPGLVPGKSLSLSTKIDSVLEKYLSYTNGDVSDYHSDCLYPVIGFRIALIVLKLTWSAHNGK